MSQSLFISYRREDSAGYARAVYDRLCDEFDREQLFIDVDAIAPGVDFVDAIDTAVGRCDALIAVIGKQWLSLKNESGRRIDDPEDYVRLEIATALRRGIRVVPLLVNDAEMPAAEELPDDLKPLARRNALQLSTTRFDADVELLIESLKSVVKPEERGSDLSGMARADYVRFIEKTMSSQRLAQRFHVLLAVLVVATGLVAIALAQLLSGGVIPSDQKWLVTLGGSFTSTLSTFPIRQIAERRTRLSALEFLLDGFRRLGDEGGDLTGRDAGRLTDRFWKLMDASLGMQST